LITTRRMSSEILKQSREWGSESMNYIIETIMQQINWTVLYFSGLQFIQINGVTLRVHRVEKNLDIRYNRGDDLYDLSKHTMRPDLTVKTEEIRGVYCDQLQGVIAEFFNTEEVDEV